MAKSAAKPRTLGTLPEWDLADLYPGPQSPEIAADLDRMAGEVADVPRVLSRQGGRPGRRRARRRHRAL